MAGWIRAAVRAAAVAAALSLCACGPRMYTPGRPPHHAVDLSHVLEPAELEVLNRKLDAYEARTHHCFVVIVLPSSHDEPHDHFSLRMLNTWGIGRKGYDDGIVLFVFWDDHVIHIATGYQLQDALPDSEATRIAREIIRPLMLPHPAAALHAGVDAVIAAIDAHEAQ